MEELLALIGIQIITGIRMYLLICKSPFQIDFEYTSTAFPATHPSDALALVPTSQQYLRFTRFQIVLNYTESPYSVSLFSEWSSLNFSQ